MATGGGVAGLLASGNGWRFAAEPRRLRRLTRASRADTATAHAVARTLTVAGDSDWLGTRPLRRGTPCASRDDSTNPRVAVTGGSSVAGDNSELRAVHVAARAK